MSWTDERLSDPGLKITKLELLTHLDGFERISPPHRRDHPCPYVTQSKSKSQSQSKSKSKSKGKGKSKKWRHGEADPSGTRPRQAVGRRSKPMLIWVKFVWKSSKIEPRLSPLESPWFPLTLDEQLNQTDNILLSIGETWRPTTLNVFQHLEKVQIWWVRWNEFFPCGRRHVLNQSATFEDLGQCFRGSTWL